MTVKFPFPGSPGCFYQNYQWNSSIYLSHVNKFTTVSSIHHTHRQTRDIVDKLSLTCKTIHYKMLPLRTLSNHILKQRNNFSKSLLPTLSNRFHTSPISHQSESEKHAPMFMRHNNVIFPPQKEGEERRPAFVCHYKEKIKYSPDKMWYIACLVRGMSVDQALIQLQYVGKKGNGLV